MRVLFVINILHMLVTMGESSQAGGVNADSRDQDASETRRAMIARMDQTIGTANKLSEYTGQLKDQQGWNYTINDKPLRLYAIHNENMAIKRASRYCREYGPSTNTIGITRL